PAAELHRFAADDASNRLAAEEPLEDVEADVPAGGAPGDEPAIDVVPERQAGAARRRLELPPDVVATPAVLEQARRLGPPPLALRVLLRRQPDRRELHRAHGAHVPIGVERRPFG